MAGLYVILLTSTASAQPGFCPSQFDSYACDLKYNLLKSVVGK